MRCAGCVGVSEAVGKRCSCYNVIYQVYPVLGPNVYLCVEWTESKKADKNSKLRHLPTEAKKMFYIDSQNMLTFS